MPGRQIYPLSSTKRATQNFIYNLFNLFTFYVYYLCKDENLEEREKIFSFPKKFFPCFGILYIPEPQIRPHIKKLKNSGPVFHPLPGKGAACDQGTPVSTRLTVLSFSRRQGITQTWIHEIFLKPHQQAAAARTPVIFFRRKRQTPLTDSVFQKTGPTLYGKGGDTGLHRSRYLKR